MATTAKRNPIFNNEAQVRIIGKTSYVMSNDAYFFTMLAAFFASVMIPRINRIAPLPILFPSPNLFVLSGNPAFP